MDGFIAGVGKLARRGGLLCVAAGLAFGTPTAQGAVGDLTVAGCFGRVDGYACASSWSPPNGRLGKVVVARDGVNAYAIGAGRGNLVARFHRAADGNLSFAGCVGDHDADGCEARLPRETWPMVSPSDIEVSPDGRDVYVVAYYSDTILHFRVDAHGDLAYVGCDGPLAGGCDPIPGDDGLLQRPDALAISPDGRSVYARGTYGSLVEFDRGDDGDLAFTACHGNYAGCDAELSHRILGQYGDIGVSPEGDAVYLATGDPGSSYSAVTQFTRAANGRLTFHDCISPNADVAQCDRPPAGTGTLRRTGTVDVGRGGHLYVTAWGDEPGDGHTVVHLARGADGRLDVRDCLGRDSNDCSGVPGDSMTFATLTALTPDGRSFYASSNLQRATNVFRVGSGGALAFQACRSDIVAECAAGVGTGSGSLTSSPDGRHLYAPQENGGVLVLARQQEWTPPPATAPPPPPAPGVTTLAAGAVGRTQAVLYARVNALGQGTTARFEFDDGRAVDAGAVTGDSANHELDAHVGGLQASTTYRVRIAATNPAGTTRGRYVSFRTAPAVPASTAAVLRETGPRDRTVTFQVGPEHAGFLDAPRPAPPLVERWALDVGVQFSNALVADGRVFAIVYRETGPQQLLAIDADTGGIEWAQSMTDPLAEGLAYDDGRVYALEEHPMVSPFGGGGTYAHVSAFDAATGERVWSRRGAGAFTADAGTLYFVSNQMLEAWDGATGATRWSTPVDYAVGFRAQPTLSGDGVFAAAICSAMGFDRTTGARRWRLPRPCADAVGVVPLLAGGRLHVAQEAGGHVLDPATGAVLGDFDYQSPNNEVTPAFAPGVRVEVRDGKLLAREPGGGLRWSVPTAEPIVTAPLIVGAHVFAGDLAGGLHAVRLADGAEVWAADAGPRFLEVGWRAFGPTTLSAGAGLLVANAGGRLVAFSAPAVAETPPPDPGPDPPTDPPTDPLPGEPSPPAPSGAEPEPAAPAPSASPGGAPAAPERDAAGSATPTPPPASPSSSSRAPARATLGRAVLRSLTATLRRTAARRLADARLVRLRFAGDGRPARLELQLRAGRTILASGTARWRGRERVTLRLRLTPAGLRLMRRAGARGTRVVLRARRGPQRGAPTTDVVRVRLR